MKGVFIDYEYLASLNGTGVEKMIPMKESFGDFNVTGYAYRDYLIENFKLIKQLNPDIRHIAFCYDNRYKIAFFEAYIKNLCDQVDSLDLYYLDGGKLTTQQLLDSISLMDDSHALLTGGWYTDAAQYPHAHSMLHNALSHHTSIPVFQSLDQGKTNMNFIGGYFISGVEMGKDLASLVHSVLTKGISKSPEFQYTPSQPRYYINYPTFVKAGFELSSLPEGAVLYNRTPSLWEQHSLEIVLLFCLIVLMIVIFFGILMYRRRKEENYKTANLKMMELLSCIICWLSSERTVLKKPEMMVCPTVSAFLWIEATWATSVATTDSVRALTWCVQLSTELSKALVSTSTLKRTVSRAVPE